MKSESDPHLIELATSVADGARVEWDRESSASASDADRQLIDGLRLLERIADVHTRTGPRPQVSTDPAPPTEWGGLHVLEVIGQGATGYVCRAWDPHLERHIALKIIEPHQPSTDAADTLSDSEIVSEGRLMARIKHDNVVTVFGADQIGGRVGLRMELVEGRTLEAEVRDRGPLPHAEIEQIALHVADALAAVQKAGLVHRDVKAQNVVRDRTGRTVLMDFGTGIDLARHADVMSMAGTPLYLAPEVIDGGPATPQTDVYALGVLLFHIATGQFPVRGATLREVRRAHSRGDRQVVASVRPDLPSRLVQIIDRALAPMPGDRFADAAHMAAELRSVRARSARRMKTIALAAAMLLVAVAGALIALQFMPAGRTSTGMTWTMVGSEFSRRVDLRGPAVDGEWAPCSSPSGTRNLALCNLVNNEVRVLRTSSRATIGQQAASSLSAGLQSASWRALVSPDGLRVAYLWHGEPEPGITTLNVIGVDGSNPRVLFTSDVAIWLDEWTSDNRALLIRLGMDSAEHRAILVPTDGGHHRDLLALAATDRRTTLSPDGQTLVIERARSPSNADLFAMNVSTGRESWRIVSPTNDVFPVWQPDGRGVVFVSDPNGCRQIVKVPVSNESIGPVSTLHEVGTQQAELHGFGANGALLVRLVDRDLTAYLAPIALEQATLGAPRTVQPDCMNVTGGANWSPDGNRIALVRGSAGPDQGMELVLTDAEGRAQASYSIPGRWSNNSEATWSPDGKTLAVSHGSMDVPQTTVLSQIEIDHPRTVRELARSIAPTVPLRRPRWDPTGQFVLYQNYAIRRVAVDSRENKEFYRLPDEPPGRGAGLLTDAGFDVADDGAMVFGVSYPDAPLDCRIRIVEREGRAIDRHVFAGHACHGIVWNRDATRILVGTRNRAQTLMTSLWMLGRNDGAPVQIATDTRPFRHLSLSPDDRQLLFTVGAGASSWGLLQGIDGLTAPAAPRSSVPQRVQTLMTEPPPEVVLSGRITDENGRPFEGLYVYSYRRTVKDGAPILKPFPPAMPTDADGRFRLAGRPVGDYVVVASTFISPAGSGAERRVPPPIIGPGGVRLAYVSRFYQTPGSGSPGPTVVPVASGEKSGLDITLVRRPVFDIRGSVIGLPLKLSVPPIIDASRILPGPEWPQSSRRTDLKNGEFVFRDMPEGRYRIGLRTGSLVGETEVIVSDREVKPVTIVMREIK